MLCRNVMDQLLNEDRLAYTGASKQTDLSALCIGGQKVNNLDSRLQDLRYRTLFLK